MRCINVIILLLFYIVTNSQNLISNSGFDNYTLCPIASGDLTDVTPWIKSIGTPDYFNACFTNPSVSVPKNLSGYNYQVPRSNSAYAGFSTIYTAILNSRENISAPLITNLLNNNYYLVKFYVSTAQAYKLSSNNIALNFSSTLTTTVSAGNTVNLPMHIYKFGNPVIKDTLNWTEIMGIYKANGTEQYITIGNFKDDVSTKVDTTNNTMFTYAAYYMVDDVSVEPICTPFWGYRDTTVTVGDSVLIGPAITGLNINWYDSNNNFIANAPAIYVKPNSPTYYTASEDFCNGITTHTINVMVTPTSVKDYYAFTNSISLFPNPTTNSFTILNLTESSKLEIEITDTQGSLCSKELITITDNKVTIKTNLANGIYFISITNNLSGSKAVKKLIVQK